MFEALYEIRDTHLRIQIHKNVYVIFYTINTFQIAFIFLYKFRDEAIQVFTVRFVDCHFAVLGGKHDMNKKFDSTHGLGVFFGYVSMPKIAIYWEM
jgi:hypothetical protein